MDILCIFKSRPPLIQALHIDTIIETAIFYGEKVLISIRTQLLNLISQYKTVCRYDHALIVIKLIYKFALLQR